MTLKYTIARSELKKKKPKVRARDISGAHNEHRDSKPVISVLRKMKEHNIGRAC